MLIDSHAHLNFEAFDKDWREVISSCQKEKVWMINVGAQLQTSRKAVEIANEYKAGVYAAVGLHPIHVIGSTYHPEEFNVDNYRDLIKSSSKVVAIGETGLDFFHSDKNIDNQKKIFAEHTKVASNCNLPLIIHNRNSKDGKQDACKELLIELKKLKQSAKGVIHSFSGTIEQALDFIQLGYFIGLNGIITFDKTGKSEELVKALPLESIIIETDCPYLTPEPKRGQRNRPENVLLVAEKIAEIRGLSYNKIEKQTVENAINLFNLPLKPSWE